MSSDPVPARPDATGDGPPDAAPDAPSATRRFTLNEDWFATILGLVLLVAALVGAIPAGLVP